MIMTSSSVLFVASDFGGSLQQQQQLVTFTTSNATAASASLLVAVTSATVTVFHQRLLTLVNLLYAVVVIPISVVGNAATVAIAACLVRNRQSTTSARKSVPDACVGLLAVLDLASVLCIQLPAVVATLNAVNATATPTSTSAPLPMPSPSPQSAGPLCSFEALSIGTYVRLQLIVQVAAAVDRYAALTHPLRYHRISSNRILRLIGITVGAVGLTTIGVSLMIDVGRREHRLVSWPSVCVFEWRRLGAPVDYVVAVLLALAFCAAFGTFVGCNASLVRILWRYHARRADEAGILREITTAMEAVGGGRDPTKPRGICRQSPRQDGPGVQRVKNGDCKTTANDRTKLAASHRNKPEEPDNGLHENVDSDNNKRHSPADYCHRLDYCNAMPPPPPVVFVEPPTKSATTDGSTTNGADRISCKTNDKNCDELIGGPGQGVTERRRSSANETGDSRLAASPLATLGPQSMKKSVSFACSPTVVIVDNRRPTSGRHAAAAPTTSRHRRMGNDDAGGESVLPRVPSDGNVTKRDPSELPVRPRQLFYDDDFRHSASNRLLPATAERNNEDQRANAIAATDRVAYVEQQLQKLLRKAERKTRNQRHRLYLVRLVIVCAAVYVMSWIPYTVRLP